MESRTRAWGGAHTSTKHPHPHSHSHSHCIASTTHPPRSFISLFCCSTLVHARKVLAPPGSSSAVDVVPAVSTFTRIATTL